MCAKSAICSSALCEWVFQERHTRMRQITNVNWFGGKVGPLNLYPASVWPAQPPHWLCCCCCRCYSLPLWFDGLSGGCAATSVTVCCSPELCVTRSWSHHIQSPKSKMEYKAGSVQCIYNTSNHKPYGHNRRNRLTRSRHTHTHTHRQVIVLCASNPLWKCARKRNGKLWKQIKNDHRGSSAHNSAFTTVSINC